MTVDDEQISDDLIPIARKSSLKGNREKAPAYYRKALSLGLS
ncbi:MAG: hypothetical protein ACFFCX_17380 [Candidatus Sifarchaeia archaeon]